MKRDWDLIRKQLTAIEEDDDVFADIPPEPKEGDFATWDEYESAYQAYEAIERRIFGHLDLLIKGGYVEGIEIIRSLGGGIHYAQTNPRLTMDGHDLLDTMRSQSLWESIKANAKSKGIELTFDAIRALGGLALKQLVGGA
ncbi:DUF2513 domain-containing protein [Rhodocyclus tenuis]|uniref:DUF2513 domain-containing protein n=1 Tax=Rhodocyclus tenuis TaxID=1066 RepID=A0A840GBC8_RHOTE|nr:DUF2513 domain-containing protein [Rhodocyclus tenuis]MBB4247968.1 hypothetical protein [Rhodocyclus tenuis]